MNLITRTDNEHKTYEVDVRGSKYISYLHRRLEKAEMLANEVERINSSCPTLGAGFLANLKELAFNFLEY